jgi:hypothetical protein
MSAVQILLFGPTEWIDDYTLYSPKPDAYKHRYPLDQRP